LMARDTAARLIWRRRDGDLWRVHWESWPAGALEPVRHATVSQAIRFARRAGIEDVRAVARRVGA
jgi:hypothetical protein